MSQPEGQNILTINEMDQPEGPDAPGVCSEQAYHNLEDVTNHNPVSGEHTHTTNALTQHNTSINYKPVQCIFTIINLCVYLLVATAAAGPRLGSSTLQVH